MNRTIKYFVIFGSVAFALTRLCGVRNDVFKDFAHVWIGGLLAAWATCQYLENVVWTKQASEMKWMTGIMFLALCAVELLAALVIYPIGK